MVSVQVQFSHICVRLAAASPDLVPVSTVLLMAEHALDLLAESEDFAAVEVLANIMAAIRSNGVWQQLDPEKATSLGIRALEHFGAAPHCLCMYIDHVG